MSRTKTTTTPGQTVTVAGKGRPARGTITVPADKSISHRALILGCLASGETRITNLLDGGDVESTQNALRALGARIETSGGITTVRCGELSKPSGVIDAGNSGTTARLLMGALSARTFESTVTGDIYLRNRPMGRVITPLRLMGADFSSQDGKLPVSVRGGALKGVRYETPVASAQVKSAILLAGLFARGDTTVVESAKTRDHTEIMLRLFGAEVETEGTEITVREGGAGLLRGTEVEVPADLSSAIFPVAAALVSPGSRVTVENVGVNPARTGALDILADMGADIRLSNRRSAGGEPVADIEAAWTDGLKGIDISPERVPGAIDEIPAIAAVACFAHGATTVSGASELRVKESDRITAMTDGLRNLGAKVEELPDGMRVEGGRLRGGSCSSAGDHRVAMALAVAATGAEGNSSIKGAGCVDISFKGFFDFLERLRTAL